MPPNIEGMHPYCHVQQFTYAEVAEDEKSQGK